ncbi:MAG: ankyrin repeat domain-containing protein [Campylobacter sp.]|nr:ankyrin repeat domain-containing protein [Campylobacter sp.]
MDCDYIGTHKDVFSSDPKDLTYMNEKIFTCDGSALNLAPVANLLEIAKIIRGENQSCVGNAVYTENLNQFRWLVLKAGFAPEIYGKTLQNPQNSEVQKDMQMSYFRYWANKSLYNFIKYKQFLKFYNDAQTPLVKFYEQKGIDAGSAAYYATSLVNEFLTFAVDKQEIGKANMKFDLSYEQKKLSDTTISVEYVTSMLYSKNFTPFDLTNMLNTALLYEQNVDILNEILKRGAQINFGDETPIFFALKNLKNVKFLIEKGADVNHKNFFGKSALFYAVQFDDMKLVELLVANGANVNERYIDENTKIAMLNLGEESFLGNTCALEHTSRSVFMHAAAHASA